MAATIALLILIAIVIVTLILTFWFVVEAGRIVRQEETDRLKQEAEKRFYSEDDEDPEQPKKTIF